MIMPYESVEWWGSFLALAPMFFGKLFKGITRIFTPPKSLRKWQPFKQPFKPLADPNVWMGAAAIATGGAAAFGLGPLAGVAGTIKGAVGTMKGVLGGLFSGGGTSALGTAMSIGKISGYGGLGLNIVGAITGNKDLQRIGSTMGMVGLGLNLGGGIIGGNAASAYSAEQLAGWKGEIANFFGDSADITKAVTPMQPSDSLVASKQTRLGLGQGADLPPELATGTGIIGQSGQFAGAPPPRVSGPLKMPAPWETPTVPEGTKDQSWWESMSMSDKLALGGTALNAVGGYQQGQNEKKLIDLKEQELSHGGPNPRYRPPVLSRVRQNRVPAGSR